MPVDFPRPEERRKERAGRVHPGPPSFFEWGPVRRTASCWDLGEVRPLAVEALGERYRRYRLADPAAEEAMARSLRQYGQPRPWWSASATAGRVARWLQAAGGGSAGLARRTFSARVVEADEATAKAAIYGLNRIGGQPSELEEAWLVHALVREDGLTQVRAAELLGQHKSWVCRRLALLERLCARQGGTATGSAAADAGATVDAVARGQPAGGAERGRGDRLDGTEDHGVIDLLRRANPEQEHFILEQPREALLQAEGVQGPIREPC